MEKDKMQDISLFRLNCLRGLYLFIAVGFGVSLLPNILSPHTPAVPTRAVVDHMLLAFWLLTLFGVRYPLQMLPVLLWEMIWKTLWVVLVAIPQWRSGRIEPFTEANLGWIPLLIVFYAVVPWRYVYANYLLKPSEPWRKKTSAPRGASLAD
ncbi:MULTISPECIES: hypothetical protein [unclassified Chromobacterium]|uniref:hypothetical protein n=1 Tax=unclassified Chromobacterium TaxID=2641838 RepID=UPI0011B2675D|nr:MULTISPECIES: hypothetical protein [unclassified Chromobacterium]MCP1289216.1 hypothetical protein [Chromobacterium sp. S0633]UJB33792.1 hypothetical protein HQN78_23670 [Chromobacterium sp. Beijing]